MARRSTPGVSVSLIVLLKPAGRITLMRPLLTVLYSADT